MVFIIIDFIISFKYCNMIEKDKIYVDKQINHLANIARIQQDEIKLLKVSMLELIHRIDKLEKTVK